MRIVFSVFFWIFIVLASGLAVLIASDNLLFPMVAGFSGVPGRKVLLGALAVLLALAAGAFVIRRHLRQPPALWRLGILGALAAVLIYGAAIFLFQPINETRVTYESNGARIVATLFTPNSDGKVPAIFIGHGSGRLPRAAYYALAYSLARKGFAVLLADKRGVGDSGGEYETRNAVGAENFKVLAGDMASGVRYLMQRPEVDAASVGVLGISQSGWIAPQAALMEPGIRFIWFITAPTVSTGEEDLWSDIRGDEMSDAQVDLEAAEAQIEKTAPEGFDPRADIAQLNIPVFWQFAGNDDSIPTRKSVSVLEPLMAAGKPFTLKVYDGFMHGLLGMGDIIIPDLSSEAITDGVSWVRQVAGRQS